MLLGWIFFRASSLVHRARHPRIKSLPAPFPLPTSLRRSCWCWSSPSPRTTFRSAGTTEACSSTADSLITRRPRPSRACGCHSIRRGIGLGAVHLFEILTMLPPCFPRKHRSPSQPWACSCCVLETAKLARPFTLSEVLDFRPRDIPNVEPLPPIPASTRPVTAFRHPIIEPNLIDPARRSPSLSIALLWRTELGAPGASRACCTTAIRRSPPIPSPPTCARCCSNTSATPATASS